MIGGSVPRYFGRPCDPHPHLRTYLRAYTPKLFQGGIALPFLPDFPKSPLEILLENVCPYILGGPVPPPPFPIRERVP